MKMNGGQALVNSLAHEGVRVVRGGEVASSDARRAYCQVGTEPPPGLREQDFIVDLAAVMERFPLFPA